MERANCSAASIGVVYGLFATPPSQIQERDIVLLGLVPRTFLFITQVVPHAMSVLRFKLWQE